MSIFHKKSLDAMRVSAERHSLRKTLGAMDLLLLGVGCVIGTGIFVLTGVAAAQYAGPAITVSYALAGFACIFAALAYAELASMVPVAGSAYTYTYVAMGEIVAWMVGWGLILEYAVGASTVAAGWSGYLVGILNSAGIHMPELLTKVPSDGGIVNLPAVLIALFVGLLLTRGTKESARLNKILVSIKLGAIFIFLAVAAPHIKTANWTNFAPYGFDGITSGAAFIFFAYVGFDAVACGAEECRNPKRDLPIGIIGSLLVCTILYILVAGTLTGIVPFATLNNAEPLASALRANGSNIGSALVATGAIAGMTTVLLVLMYGQSRIFFVMSRDGLLPKFFSKLHPRFQTPYISSMLIGLAVALISGFTPIHTMGNLTSMGTLFAFIIVAIGVIVLRITHPNEPRPFKCPAVYIIAPIAVLSCGYLIYKLFLTTGKPFLIWGVIGLVVYLGYKSMRPKAVTINDHTH
jgi:APA family basic amino acid/polyamine antiporter